LKTRHYSTAVQILGQGVLTGLFRNVFKQLASAMVSVDYTPSPRK
jgi:hypothetical protein